MKRLLCFLVLCLSFTLSSTSFASTVADDAPTAFVISDMETATPFLFVNSNLTVDYTPVNVKPFLETNRKAILTNLITFEKSVTDYASLMYRHKQMYLTTLKTESGTDSLILWRKAREGIYHQGNSRS